MYCGASRSYRNEGNSPCPRTIARGLASRVESGGGLATTLVLVVTLRGSLSLSRLIQRPSSPLIEQ
jgi:hypothetical protein